MELQCKERVDLLEALRQSRMDDKSTGDKQDSSTSVFGRFSSSKTPNEQVEKEKAGWLGQGTVPAVKYPDLSRPAPPLPARPAMSGQKSADLQSRPPTASHENHLPDPPSSYSPPALPPPLKHVSRTPSPEKRNRMLTTLRPSKDGKRPARSPRTSSGKNPRPLEASKAAGLAWDSISRASGSKIGQSLTGGSTTTLNSVHRDSFGDGNTFKRESLSGVEGEGFASQSNSSTRPYSPLEYLSRQDLSQPRGNHEHANVKGKGINAVETKQSGAEDHVCPEQPVAPLPQPEMKETNLNPVARKLPNRTPQPVPDYLTYRNEYPAPTPSAKASLQGRHGRVGEDRGTFAISRQRSPQRKIRPPIPPPMSRRPAANASSPQLDRIGRNETGEASSESADENTSSSREAKNEGRRLPRRKRSELTSSAAPTTPPSTDRDSPEGSATSKDWTERLSYIKKHLPKGIDEGAAKQIFNEIVVQGDEVHWDDVAGLDAAKKALKEAVVYPFLRPDLFMGLREPARGMLLFGPPGTGKTMLARAVATESRSTFFAISASSLTSKWLGESEKLVRALFALARALAPSIIFVDEIDSLLSSRGGSSEHESTRRIKTEFLIQWSDLQRAAAGKEQTDKEKKEGDASRVLVLAATNLPWAIDEAARRRFVRRQYIPLPEAHVRRAQLETLLGHQKHELNEQDLEVLVQLTDGKPYDALIRGRSYFSSIDNFQATLAPISPLSPKTQPWVLYAVSARRSCRCPWTRFGRFDSRTLKLV